MFQGLGIPLPLGLRLLTGYGSVAIPLFGVLAAAAWVLSDIYFRGRWIQWLLIAVFAFVIFGIFVELVHPYFGPVSFPIH